MDIPRFNDANIAPEMKISATGETFQDFVFDLLSEKYTDLTKFRAKGKDGAIDHIIHFSDGRGVVECKDIQDGYKNALKNWATVADKLKRNISPPDGPLRGQRQYSPWYDKESPIHSYIFYVSGKFDNASHIEIVKNEIKSFFNSLSSQYDHLTHLSDIQVECIPWNRIESQVKRQAKIAFKWFPACRPIGLTPLRTEKKTTLNFRRYLDYHHLPFFSPEMFEQESKLRNTALFNVTQLLENLRESSNTGLIITGIGGIGKTRLVMELGHCASKNKWLVLQASKRICVVSVDSLCKCVDHANPVLILFDYVETQQGFSEIVDTINEYNDEYGYCIRYVSNCRTNFYANLREMERHTEVNLSPGGKNAELYQSFRKATVRHILSHSGLEKPEDYIHICQALPILAVFLSFLKQNGRDVELDELRRESSFISWINKRIKASFSGLYPNNTQGMLQDLSRLLVQYPIPENALEKLAVQYPDLNRLHVHLVNDGWVQEDDNSKWVSVHDIFVDQIMSDFFQHSQQPKSDIKRALELGCRLSTLKSVLLSYQRIAEELAAPFWLTVIEKQIDRNTEQWMRVRDVLISTPLLNSQQVLELLNRKPDFWAGAEKEISIQNALGYFAKLRVKGELRIPPNLLDILLYWLEKAVESIGRSNFVLNWALRLSPERFVNPVKNWIQSKPRLFQSHYLMVAWLEVKLPIEEMAEHVRNWCHSFVSDRHVTFLVKSWLHAGGERELVKDAIIAWLEYEDNAEREDVDFLIRSWIKAHGDFALVKKPACRWLAANKNKYEAVYITKRLARQKELPVETIIDVLDWCRNFFKNEDAIYRLAQLRLNLQRDDIADEALKALTLILPQVLHKKVMTSVLKSHVIDIFVNLAYNPKLENREKRETLIAVFAEWIKDPRSFSPFRSLDYAKYQQSPGIFKLFFDAFEMGYLNKDEDIESAKSFIIWVNDWERNRREKIKKVFHCLINSHDLVELYSLINFNDD